MKTMYQKFLYVLILLPFLAFAQSGTVTGVVTDGATGMPLPGVNIIVKGTTNGTTSDFDGNYTISRLNNGDVLDFSYVGYVSKSVNYTGQRTVNVVLEEDAGLLEGVTLVAIGYGAVQKRDLTGAVTQVSAKDFNKGANVTAENLLNGKVAGLSINTSGAPGSGSEIRIRGGASLNASNDPLIVIDGLPITNANVTGSTSVLSSINPNDIESITVLKDASATAIYGLRGANGVIIINTKRAGKTLQVEFNTQYGTGRRFNQIDVLSGDQYRDLILGPVTGVDPVTQQPIRQGGIGTPAEIANIGNANTDWQREIYRRTDFMDSNLSMRGSLFGVIPTRLSIGNTYQEGLRLTNNFTRNNVALNMSPSLFDDHLKIRLQANYSNQRSRFADGVEGSAIRFNPTQPVFNPNMPGGFFEYYTNNNFNQFLNPSTPNPVAQLLQTNDRGVANRIFGNVEFDYKFHFLPELRAVVNLGYDENDGSRTRFRPNIARSSFLNNNQPLGTQFDENNIRTSKLLDAYLAYNKSFENFNLDVTGGYSYQRFENSGQRGFEATDPNPNNERIFYVDTPLTLIAFFGRANLSFKDKYLFTLTMRREGTSRFGPDNRWENFPAAAFAWRLKDEFFKDYSKLSDLKLRLGWGISGQQDIPQAEFYLPTYNVGDNVSQIIIGGQPIPVGVPRPTGPIFWEKTYTYNGGFDFGFFDNRLTGSLDAYYKVSRDLIQLNAPFPDGTNYTNQGPLNIGSLNVKGVELTMGYDVVRKEDFNWNVSFNVTRFERRLDEIALGQPILEGPGLPGTGGTTRINQQGFTPFSFFVYKQLYDNAGNPIEGAFADLNGDGIINADDRYIYKNPDPDLLLGFTSNLNYKNFDLSFNLRGSVGNRVMNLVDGSLSYRNSLFNGVAENISTNYFNTGFLQQNEENMLSDMFIENGSFLRMDFATLGYTFSNWLDGKASLRLFTTVQNPFIITKYSGLDPEITGGVDNTIYPRQRQFLIGANIKF